MSYLTALARTVELVALVVCALVLAGAIVAAVFMPSWRRKAIGAAAMAAVVYIGIAVMASAFPPST